MATLTFGLPTDADAQQPVWRPSRIPANSQAQPLSSQPRPAANRSAIENAAESAARVSRPATATEADASQPGSSVALRWKSPGPSASDAPIANAQFAATAFASAASPLGQEPRSIPQARVSENPLRSQVRRAAYQQDGQEPYGNPFADDALTPPSLPPTSGTLPNLPNVQEPRTSPELSPQLNPPGGFPPTPPSDPLSTPEIPPPPTEFGRSQPSGNGPEKLGEGNRGLDSILEDPAPPSPFPRPLEDASPRDRSGQSELIPPGFEDEKSNDLLPRGNVKGSLSSCNELRSRMRGNPLTAVTLDVSPAFGEGLRSAKRDSEQQRLDFAASADVREWRDYRGNSIATGRLIDLRYDRVVIDAGGAERSIPLRDLSDVDVAYVGESWNIPERCGTGYEPFEGRQYIASTVQWKASGLCHKPLYFEQVQLERYGHEVGPILQPLISTAHFFGNIPLLPYKMGIHPPNECQYALGYFRPGNCAPYMIQPIPWSLRGAAVQAGVVTGAAALIP